MTAMNDSAHHTRLPPALYVVATPIGNLGDITLRALDTLKCVELVAAVRAAGLTVVPIPGVSAVTAALSAAGVESGQWLFHGFLPPKSGARKAQLQTLAALPAALVLYEEPHRTEGRVDGMGAG